MNSLQKLSAKILTKRDYKLESTAQSINEFEHLLQNIDLKSDSKYVDIGCGEGGFTKLIQEYFKLNKAYGIDNNSRLLKKAKKRNIITYEKNIMHESLPFDDSSIDFITCLGVLEHLKEFDTIFKEINRVLKKDGVVIFAVPNLSSWINRITLLSGWQPRNVEISDETLVNTAPWYKDNEILHHIHAPTYNAFIELLEYYEYNVENTMPLFPYQENLFVEIIDYITLYRPQLSRRFGVVAKK